MTGAAIRGSINCVILGTAIFLCSLSVIFNWAHTAAGWYYLWSYELNWKDGCANIWPFDLLAVIFTGMLGLTAALTALVLSLMCCGRCVDANPCDWATEYRLGAGTVSSALFIWGIIILAKTDASCRDSFENDAPELWALFVVSFSYAVVHAAFALTLVPSLASRLFPVPPRPS